MDSEGVPHSTGARELAIAAAAKCSREKVETLPALSELVVTTEARQRASLLERILDVEKAVEAEVGALDSLRKDVSPKEFKKFASPFDEACERRSMVHDLKARAEALFVDRTSFPVSVPIITKAQTTELLQAFHAYRDAYWELMYRVPAIQRHVFGELSELLAEGRVANLVVMDSKINSLFASS
jgi:hypothetical protein